MSFRHKILQSKGNSLFFNLIVISNKVSNHVACLLTMRAPFLHWAAHFSLLSSVTAWPQVSRKTACSLLLLNLFVCLFVFGFWNMSLFVGMKVCPRFPRRKEGQIRTFFSLRPRTLVSKQVGLVWKIFPSIRLYRVLPFFPLVSLEKCHKVKKKKNYWGGIKKLLGFQSTF